MSDELQNHMNKGMYGTPQINPDERRKYLGTFRERVDVVITFEELNNPESLLDLSQEMSIHPDFRLIINGQVDAASLSKLVKLANDHGIDFTATSDHSLPNDSTDFAVVFCDKTQAIHKEKIDIFECYPRKRRIRLSLSIVLSWKDFSTKKEIERKKPRFPLELNIMPNIV